MESGEEIITLKINVSTFDFLKHNQFLHTGEYEIQKIETKGEEYPEDENWVQLKKESNDSYRKLKEYEFNKRNP